jgi:glucose/arabinose dehydrogenase
MEALRARAPSSGRLRVARTLVPFALLAGAILASDRAPSSKALPEEPHGGEGIFRQRCALCHPTGAESAQGPTLGGVLGRKAAAVRGFGYSRALRDSGLTWDRQTLDRFLVGPGDLVPGTTMPMILPVTEERQGVIDYLASLPTVVSNTVETRASPGDYHGDAPGVRRRITVAGLPAPQPSQSVPNGPSVVDPPRGGRPAVPPGFAIDRFAKDLENPRLLRVAPNGDIFVAESSAGQVRVLRARDGETTPRQIEVFAQGLDRPFGIAFYPPGGAPRWVYVADTDSVVRFAYESGDLRARAPPETVIPRLTRTKGGHWTRDVVFSPDGARMFVSIGSASNVAEHLTPRFADEITLWEASHGLGAAWDDEQDRADVMVFDPEGHGGRAFATGIRNCVGLAIGETHGDLWCATNERDELGDDLVPDYVTRVREGAFYGWPWFYLGAHEDPRHEGARPDLTGRVSVPDVLLQAHSAPLELTFYDGGMFPASYRGSLFVSLHGSWNRRSRTGPKVIRVLVDQGAPTGEYEDFVTGFVADGASVWARPVGVATAHDGALLVSEDANGTIWRVSYSRGNLP